MVYLKRTYCLKLVSFRCPNTTVSHEIEPVFILGCDQQNMKKNLYNFKWAGHKLVHIFADGWSTGLHKRKMTLLEAPTGTLLFYYKDIK